MFTKKVPLYSTLIFFVTTCVLGYLLYDRVKLINENSGSGSAQTEGYTCNYNLARLAGYKYTHPLMFAEPACESPALNGVKSELEQQIAQFQAQGLIKSAGVYVREFKSGSWVSVGDGQKYSPGSLMKIPELITFYKMNEVRPGYLNLQVKYEHPFPSAKTTHFVSKSIELGRSYTIKELLRYMIEYSDNNATNLLNTLMDVPTFKKVFTDMGLPEPDWHSNDYPLSARDYSVFLKVLYNASYLSIADSESCLELLSKTDFNEGFESAVPEGTQMVHKFGEGGPDNSPDLSESGIIFAPGGTFLLTVMVNGPEMKKLPQALSGIARLVYQRMTGGSVAQM